MNLPEIYENFAERISPHKAKLLIVGLLGLVPVAKIFFIDNFPSPNLSDIAEKVLATSVVISFWGFGLLLFSRSFGRRKETWLAKQTPTLTRVGRWYGAIFISVWFTFLIGLTFWVSFLWLKT